MKSADIHSANGMCYNNADDSHKVVAARKDEQFHAGKEKWSAVMLCTGRRLLRVRFPHPVLACRHSAIGSATDL